MSPFILTLTLSSNHNVLKSLYSNTRQFHNVLVINWRVKRVFCTFRPLLQFAIHCAHNNFLSRRGHNLPLSRVDFKFHCWVHLIGRNLKGDPCCVKGWIPKHKGYPFSACCSSKLSGKAWQQSQCGIVSGGKRGQGWWRYVKTYLYLLDSDKAFPGLRCQILFICMF